MRRQERLTGTSRSDVSFPRRRSDAPSSEGEPGGESRHVIADNHKQKRTPCADLVPGIDTGSESFAWVDGTSVTMGAFGGTGLDGWRSGDLLHFPSGPGMAQDHQRPQAVENAPSQAFRLSGGERNWLMDRVPSRPVMGASTATVRELGKRQRRAPCLHRAGDVRSVTSALSGPSLGVPQEKGSWLP
jgi:hypothetical protein